MRKEILKIEGLTKHFGGLVAVDNLSFTVYEKSIHALIGPNGSGKTTTLNMVAGELKRTSGSIYFEGQDITGLPSYQISRLGISRTFQNIRLFSSMTCLENLMIGLQRKYDSGVIDFMVNIPRANREEKELQERADEMLAFLGMSHLRDERVRNLPYGNQKILELGRALMPNPKLILLDEPAAGLNPVERSGFINLLKRVNENGITLLLIEHNMDVVMSISECLTVLNFGKKIAEDGPREIQNNDTVIQAYLGSRYKKKD